MGQAGDDGGPGGSDPGGIGQTGSTGPTGMGPGPDSGFGGVKYTVHLEGTIEQGSLPETAPVAYDEAIGMAFLCL